MLPTLGSLVAALPYPKRVAAYTASWALCLIFQQSLLEWACVWALPRLPWGRGYMPRTSRTPSISISDMLREDVIGYLAWGLLPALYQAHVNPTVQSWDWSCPNLVLMGYWAFATLIAYDAYSFAVHKFMHDNKTAFRLLHAKHHQHKAMLDVRTSGYMSVLEGQLSAGLPLLALWAAGWATGNWWLTLAGIWNSFFIVIMGHCGHEVSMSDARDLCLVLFNPWIVWYVTTPVYAQPAEHQEHHMFPRCNYAFFFTLWDDIWNTSRPKRLGCSPLFLAVHAAWQAALLGWLALLVTRPLAFAAAWIMAYCVVPSKAVAAAFDAVRLPEALQALLGGLVDRYRADAGVAYEPEGFCPEEPEPGQAKAAAYLFAVHPTGLLSRGALLTFAARGWAGPLARLPRVRLAVGSWLLAIPGLREFLLAAGCCPADAACIRSRLAAGTSVALTPGGWREAVVAAVEPQHDNLVLHTEPTTAELSLVLAKRTGFVALAQETGAPLVPVLALGEESTAGKARPGFRLIRALVSARPNPTRVVFGRPLAPRAGESLGALHARYSEALLALGKAHGVKLRVVE